MKNIKMNENIENTMTDEQKKVYYVTKIARLSSEEYKLRAGEWVSLGIAVANFFSSELVPTWSFSPAMTPISVSIAIYCIAAKYYNSEEQKRVASELADLNKGKVKTK